MHDARRTSRSLGAYELVMSTPSVTVYYDGLCPLCSREIEHYRRRAVGSVIQFVDIAGADFSAAAHGIDGHRMHKTLHVRIGAEVRTGVDAFIAIWDAIPDYRWLARWARLPGVRQGLAVGYAVFAAVRPYLPGRKMPNCTTGRCVRD